MTELLPSARSLLVPILLGVYALAFIAGGVYYLEQRVARIRDQFPRRGPMDRLIGYAALSIGLLTVLSLAGHLMNRGAQFRLAASVATGSGVAFWVTRMHADMTLNARIRDGLLAVLCLMLTVLTGWWVGTAWAGSL